MTPLALQILLGLLFLQALLLGAGLFLLHRRINEEAAAGRQRFRALHELLTEELTRIESTVKASRAEAATLLESIFTGVRGLARNLDAARVTTAQALEELHRLEAEVAPGAEQPAVAAQGPATQAPPPEERDASVHTLEEARPRELTELKNASAPPPPARR